MQTCRSRPSAIDSATDRVFRRLPAGKGRSRVRDARQAANWLGLAIASYEWMAAITLVVVAFVFLPTFLRSGIYTMPELLEYRFNAFARTIMAVSSMIILVGVRDLLHGILCASHQ